MTTSRSLADKVALITGAGSGIGQATSILFAEHGMRVIAVDRLEPRVKETRNLVQASGGRCLSITADVRSAEDMERAVEQGTREFGGLNVVFANAGVNGVWGPIDTIDPEEWDLVMDTNLKGTYLTIRAAVPALRAAGGGSVIITSSINGTRSFSGPGVSVYASSKAGQLALGQTLALELARDAIRVNVICPGTVRTNINGTGREQARIAFEKRANVRVPLRNERADPKEVAELALFLASDASRHITGTPIWIDGGESLLWG